MGLHTNIEVLEFGHDEHEHDPGEKHDEDAESAEFTAKLQEERKWLVEEDKEKFEHFDIERLWRDIEALEVEERWDVAQALENDTQQSAVHAEAGITEGAGTRDAEAHAEHAEELAAWEEAEANQAPERQSTVDGSLIT